MVWILSFIKCALSLIKSGPRGLVLIVFVLDWVRGNPAAKRRLESSSHHIVHAHHMPVLCAEQTRDWPESIGKADLNDKAS